MIMQILRTDSDYDRLVHDSVSYNITVTDLRRSTTCRGFSRIRRQ